MKTSLEADKLYDQDAILASEDPIKIAQRISIIATLSLDGGPSLAQKWKQEVSACKSQLSKVTVVTMNL